MKRLLQRKEDFMNALKALKEGLNEPESEIVIDGILHRYEFTFELSWKLLKDYLEYYGIVENVSSPREIIKQSFKHKIIEDGETWLDMMLSRNELSHLYNKDNSRKIYLKIKDKYIEQFEKLPDNLRI